MYIWRFHMLSSEFTPRETSMFVNHEYADWKMFQLVRLAVEIELFEFRFPQIYIT